MSENQKLPEFKGHPTYRCSRCGDMFVSLDFEADVNSLRALMSSVSVMEANGVSRNRTHVCSDGGIGIGIIVGMTPTEKVQRAIAQQSERNRSAN